MAEALQSLKRRHKTIGSAWKGTGAPLLRFAPALTLALFLVPIGAGLIGTWVPAFGYLPSLGGHNFALTHWRELFAYPGLPGALKLTLISGFTATLLSFVLVMAFVAACHDRPLFQFCRRWLSPLLAVPHVTIAIGVLFLIAPSGWFVRLLSPWLTGWELPPDIALVQDPYGLALTLGLILKEAPFLLLMTLAALEQSQTNERLAIARSLGYGPVSAWLNTVLPAIYRQIRLPVYAVLAFSLSVVDMALVLAPLSPPPLAVLVFQWFNDPDLTMRFRAAAGAGLHFFLVVAAILGWRVLEILVARLGRKRLFHGRRSGPGRAVRIGASIGMTLAYGLAGASLLGMTLWSFAQRWRYPDPLPTAWTLENWHRQAQGLTWIVGTTLCVGLATAAVALVLVLACLENEKRQGLHTTMGALWLLYIPLLVPQVAFLFGTQVLAASLGIVGTTVALVWSHLLFALPYVFLSLSGPYRSLDERYVRTALCLGASADRVFWRIKLPMLALPILFAFAVGFAVSVTQYLPTVFAGAGRFATLTTEAVSLAAGADRRVIGVYAILQAALPLVLFGMALAAPAYLFRHRRLMKSER